MPGPERDRADLALLVHAAREAGAILLAHRERPYRKWAKEHGTPVTDADIAADHFLKERLLAARPAYGWISEETADDASRLSRRDVFIVDPLDGTAGFIRGKTDFTVSLAVTRDGLPVAATVFNPVRDEMFAAARGAGATLNGARIQVSAAQAIEGCRMLASRAMFSHPAWPQPWPPMEVVNPSSVAYRMALVAAGQADAMLALSSKGDWDIAAGHLLVEEAGGLATAHDGGELRYNAGEPVKPSILCAGPRLYDLLFERVGAIRLPQTGDARPR